MTGRVIAGLPHPRATWPAQLSRWATSGTAPIEFLTCLTANELKALLGSGRHVDAVVLDAASPQVDAQLAAVVAASGAVPVGLEATTSHTDWKSWGVQALLPSEFSWLQLSDLLAAHCSPVPPANVARHVSLDDAAVPGGFLVAVSGPGGTGASTVAMAIAQASVGRNGVSTLLVDGARRATLAMYHDTGEVLPGLPELIERVRTGNADPAEIDTVSFETERGYDLLLGQRSPGDWVGLDRASVAGAIEATLRRWQVVVVDHDGDLESAESTRSESMDARNAVSLELARTADLWVIVANPGTKGVSAAAGALDEAVRAGVQEHRVQVVFNRVGRSPALRSTHAAALAATTAGRPAATLGASFVPESRQLESAHRDTADLPKKMVDAAASAFNAARAKIFSQSPAGTAAHDPSALERQLVGTSGDSR